jgi:polysaccharide biosynthesis/export protein
MNLIKPIVLTFVVSLLTSPTLFAQAESLLIGPGDQLHVQVFDTPQLEQVARVTDKGELQLVFGGSVKVASLTPAQAAEAIEKALIEAKIMFHPRVSVTIEEYATQSVTVSGQVGRPGAYQITTPRSITDVLTLAGGLTDLADRHVTIQRASDGSEDTYFVSNNPKQLARHSKLVYPGDTVLVPKTGIIYVLGDVGRPGGYPMANNDAKLTVLQAIAMAGGTAPSAVPSSARLIRRTADGYENLHLPLSAMQKGKQPDQQLQADDIIYVPFSYLRNAALGITGIMASAASAAIYAK